MGQSRARSARKVGSLARAWLHVAVGTAVTLIASVASRPWRGRLVRLARELGYDHSPGGAPLVPIIRAGELCDETTSVVLREAVATDGNLDLYELLFLARLVASRRPERLFEIGTFDGRSTLNLAANAPPSARVMTLDLGPGDFAAARAGLDPDDVKYARGSATGAVRRRYVGTAEAARIVELFGDSAGFDFKPYHGTMDFVFVDGSHAYDHVMADSRAAITVAAPGAAIVWHDYGRWPGVTGALNDLFATRSEFAGLRWIEHTSLVILRT